MTSAANGYDAFKAVAAATAATNPAARVIAAIGLVQSVTANNHFGHATPAARATWTTMDFVYGFTLAHHAANVSALASNWLVRRTSQTFVRNLKRMSVAAALTVSLAWPAAREWADRNCLFWAFGEEVLYSCLPTWSHPFQAAATACIEAWARGNTGANYRDAFFTHAALLALRLYEPRAAKYFHLPWDVFVTTKAGSSLGGLKLKIVQFLRSVLSLALRCLANKLNSSINWLAAKLSPPPDAPSSSPPSTPSTTKKSESTVFRTLHPAEVLSSASNTSKRLPSLLDFQPATGTATCSTSPSPTVS